MKEYKLRLKEHRMGYCRDYVLPSAAVLLSMFSWFDKELAGMIFKGKAGKSGNAMNRSNGDILSWTLEEKSK